MVIFFGRGDQNLDLLPLGKSGLDEAFHACTRFLAHMSAPVMIHARAKAGLSESDVSNPAINDERIHAGRDGGLGAQFKFAVFEANPFSKVVKPCLY